MFKIGEVAQQTKLTPQAIRLYERNRIIKKPGRNESGYRAYTNEDVRRLNFVKNAKELGFTLKEIRELLNLKVDPKTTCAQVKKVTISKIFLFDTRIKEMQKFRRALTRLADTCNGKGPAGDCPILDAMD